MAYDVVRQRVVLFGEYDTNGVLADTWEWDGSNRAQRSPPNSPTAGSGHSMAYDVARQRVVLFGGGVGNTWEWDGNNWTQRSPTNSPSARFGHSMAYDVARQRVVMFGGMDSSGSSMPDTWEWDGSNWAQRSPTNSPSARSYHAMAYDVARQRVVLFGGRDLSSDLADTWEWDGSNWSQPSLPTSPGTRYQHAMAYDVAHQRIVLFGGSGDLGIWYYGRPAASQPFGTACSGSSSPPVLTSDAPGIGHPAFALELVNARPASGCIFGLAARRQDRPIPPCTLYLGDPILPLPAVIGWTGFAKSPTFAIPLNPNLHGLTLFVQAFVADPQGPVPGLTFSAGLRLVLGD